MLTKSASLLSRIHIWGKRGHVFYGTAADFSMIAKLRLLSSSASIVQKGDCAPPPTYMYSQIWHSKFCARARSSNFLTSVGCTHRRFWVNFTCCSFSSEFPTIDRIIVGALNNDGCRTSNEINNDNKVYLIIIFHEIEINGRHYKIVIKWFEYYMIKNLK